MCEVLPQSCVPCTHIVMPDLFCAGCGDEGKRADRDPVHQDQPAGQGHCGLLQAA